MSAADDAAAILRFTPLYFTISCRHFVYFATFTLRRRLRHFVFTPPSRRRRRCLLLFADAAAV
jgi:hypothetical protein